MNLTGEFVDLRQDFISHDTFITFKITESNLAKMQAYKLGEDKLNIKVTKYREKRSLDANAYAWVLMSKLAEHLDTSKEEVYEEMLNKYGFPVFEENGRRTILTVLPEVNMKSLGIHTKYIGSGYVGDKEFHHYLVLRGSSEYNTKEMAHFIDMIVSECKEVEIETLPEDEIKRMKEVWGIK
ncbi:hypothetical protein [Anaerosacchariphilus polymeriproducens]|uniref:Uncharacterized protein n=1 Tax=Anaerosacchariphilus polymeriproducens TaxID=1812858 RepID=A0A371ATF0_9FIRM|nr:hypothetical protein [Anaerosacchariphilus polymeriproducens]RDU22856.1 hypothetical protein DWV06_12560 [Anaerosacchariphilus polymeriproducens]